LYGAETTWIAIAAAIIMGLSGVCLFIFAVKKDYFRDFDDAKYQVFWNDIEELVDVPPVPCTQKGKNDGLTPPKR
jgi:nitrogen fixation-related uncharacterized protein